MPSAFNYLRAWATGDDTARPAKRREIKAELAGLEAVAGRRSAMQSQIRVLNQRETAAVAEHEKTCRPLQQQIEATETEITDAILKGDPVSDRHAAQRAAVLEKIATANAKLEAEVETLKKLRKQTTEEIKKLDHVVASIPKLRSQLGNPGIADPQLLIQRFVLGQEIYWADQRVRGSKKGLTDAELALSLQQKHRESLWVVNSHNEVVRDPEPDEHELRAAREVEEWQAEVEAAERAHAGAIEQRHELREQILSE